MLRARRRGAESLWAGHVPRSKRRPGRRRTQGIREDYPLPLKRIVEGNPRYALQSLTPTAKAHLESSICVGREIDDERVSARRGPGSGRLNRVRRDLPDDMVRVSVTGRGNVGECNRVRKGAHQTNGCFGERELGGRRPAAEFKLVAGDAAVVWHNPRAQRRSTRCSGDQSYRRCDIARAKAHRQESAGAAVQVHGRSPRMRRMHRT